MQRLDGEQNDGWNSTTATQLQVKTFKKHSKGKRGKTQKRGRILQCNEKLIMHIHHFKSECITVICVALL